MSRSERSFIRPVTWVAGLGLAVAMAAPAQASPETLRRSMGNILFGPFDIALSPVTSGRIIYNNLRDIDDSPWVRIVYPLPGYVWVMGINIGGGILREVTGLIELVPGIGLYFLEADLDPLYDPIERGDALVDIETDPLLIKFGMNYTSVPY